MNGMQEGGGDMEVQDAPALHTPHGTIVDDTRRPGLPGTGCISRHVSHTL